MPLRRDTRRVIAVTLPEAVRRAAAMTPAGREWLADLPALLAALEQQWGIRIGATLGGGTTAFVAAATTGAGADVVVKVALPPGIEGHASFEVELAVLLHGGPGGYVRLLDHVEPHRALLMERLGPPLGLAGLPVADQLVTIATTLMTAWVAPYDGLVLPTLEEKGRWLADFIGRTWVVTGRPCRQRTVELAQELAEERAAAFDGTHALVLHGDAHPMNLLRSTNGYRLVDPDGVVGEPEYDLAVPIRELRRDQLLPEVATSLRDRCRLIAEPAGADPEAVWQWAFVERVSTGLLCLQLGHRRWGVELLDVADSAAGDGRGD